MSAVVDEQVLAELRPELVRYCYRMLGDGALAEDAAQEVLLAGWRARERFDPGRGSVRTWLYTIATRQCLDRLKAAVRRELPTDLTDRSDPGGSDRVLPAGSWITPLPDALDPAAALEQRETIRMAFVAALQRLPPRQRAVLVLRDVYALSAAETAAVLDTNETAVHSTLQRARRTVVAPAPDGSARSVDDQLVDDFVSAFERHDVDALATLLAADVITSMPPVAFWLSGIEDVTRAFASATGCVGHRLVRTGANGSPAFGQYAPGQGPDGEAVYRPFAIVLLEVEAAAATSMVTFLDQRDRFAAFGLPETLTAPSSPSTPTSSSA